MVGDSSSPRCESAKKDGTPCHAVAANGGGRFCLGHDPALAERRAQARREGGRNKSRATRAKKFLPNNLRPIAALLERAFEETYTGALDYRRASALASLAGALVRLYQAGEFEERMSRIEERINGIGNTSH
jgi:hypothetical protein